jgi:hypothetical protein
VLEAMRLNKEKVEYNDHLLAVEKEIAEMTHVFSFAILK